jgi:quercetin dioxygenase-like cupin family protein
MVYEKERPILNCQVIASSGCHRYQYWNEQFLFNNDLTRGWSTPSRKFLQDEFILVDFGKTYIIHKVRMLSRAVHSRAGFPVNFHFLASANNENWVELFTEEEFQAQAGAWHEWIFPSVEARYVKLLVTKVGWRRDGKYFVQLMALEVYEHVNYIKLPSMTAPLKLLDVSKLRHFLPDQANKFGLYGSADMSAVLWSLEPSQKIPIHCHPNGDKLCIFLEGEGFFLSADNVSDFGGCYEPIANLVVLFSKEEPEDVQKLISLPIKAGIVVIVPRGRYHGLCAAPHSHLLCICVTAPVPEGGLYSVRHE